MIALVIVLFIVCFANYCARLASRPSTSNPSRKNRSEACCEQPRRLCPPVHAGLFCHAVSGEEGLAKFLRNFSFTGKFDLLILQSGQNSTSTKLLLTCLIAGSLASPWVSASAFC